MWPNRMDSTGTASTSATSTPPTRYSHGRRRTRAACRCHTPSVPTGSATGRRTRTRSMRRPASPSSAGTRVIAAAAATTTVLPAATPSCPMNVIPDAYSPHSAMTTVVAAMITARPLDAAVRAAASTGSAPSSSACRWRVVRNRA